jgi:hypothetical protein
MVCRNHSGWGGVVGLRFDRVVVVGLVLPLLFALGLPLEAAHAATAGVRPDTSTLTWKGTDSCSWSDANNWTPQQAPASGDSVDLDGSAVRKDICSVPTIDLDQVTFTNGITVSGSGATTITANDVTWTDGSVGVSLDVTTSLSMLDAGGHYEVDGSPTAPQVTLTSEGTTDMVAGATLGLTAGALIVNDGTWRIDSGTGPAAISSSICCSTLSTFENAGVLSGGNNGLNFSNMGYVGDSGGVIADGVVTVDYGISTLKSGTLVEGFGGLAFVDNAQVNATGTITLTAGTTLQQGSGATLNGTAVTIAGDGTYEWSGGTVDASLTIAQTVRLLVDGSATKILDGTGSKKRGTLMVNGPTVQQDTGPLELDGGHATVINNGTWSVAAPQDVKVVGESCCSPSSPWRNMGELEVAPGATFDLNNATFDDAPAGVVTGGGTLDLGYGPQTFEAGGTVAGGTTMILDRNGSLTGRGALNLAGGSVLALEGNGSLLGTTDLTGSGAFDWSRGTIGGTLDVKPGVSTNIVDLAQDASHGRSIASAGTKPASFTVEGGAVQDSASPISVGAGISANNARGSTWTIDDGGMSGSVCCASPANVANNGTLDVAAGGSGDSAVMQYLQFVNRGSFDVAAGTISFNALSPEQVKGTTVVDADLTTGLPYVLEGGRLQGAGTVTGDLTNDMGVVSPGDGVGTLTITGDFNESPDAVVVADLKDAKSDQLVVDGNASLNGTLQLSLDQTGVLTRTPRVLVQAGAVTQSFATVSGLSTLGSTWKTKTTSTQVQLLPK